MHSVSITMRRFKHERYWRQSRQFDKKNEKIKLDIPKPKPYIVLFANPVTPPKPNELFQNYLIYTEPAIDPDKFFKEINKIYPDTKTVDLIRFKWGNNNLLVMLSKPHKWAHIDWNTRAVIEAIVLDDS